MQVFWQGNVGNKQTNKPYMPILVRRYLAKIFHFSASSKSEMSIFLKMGFIHHKKKHKIFDGKLVLGLNPSPFTYYGNRIIFFNGLILV